MQVLQQFFPLFESLKGYTKSLFRADLMAGLTVGIMLVPQGMAYAFLAGMPPIYGLYGGLIPLFLYALLGTSRQLAIGPVAVSALLVLGGVSQLAEPQSPEYIRLVITAGLMIGIMQAAFSFLRLGFLVNFLPHPVIAGFTSAAAIIIAISQLKDFLGFSIPSFAHSHETLLYAIANIQQTNWISVLFCTSGIALIFGLRSINKNLPGALIVVIIGTLLSWGFDLESYGLNIVKSVPEGLPVFQLPDLQMATLKKLIPTVLTVTIIGIVESIGIAKVLEAKHQDYVVRPNQELLALGVSKIGGAFFQAIPSSGSFTRSAINNDSGAKTQVSGIITAILIALTLLFLTPLFFYLPKAILAAIILLAVKSLFDLEEAVHLWQTHKSDFAMMLITFITTLVINIPIGILMGVVLSIGAIMYRSALPHVAFLGQIPETLQFVNIKRVNTAKELTDTLIMRFDDQLFFANANYFKDVVKAALKESNRPLKYFYLDATNMHNLDSSGLNALKEMYTFLKNKGIQLIICGATEPVQDLLHKSHLMEVIGEANHFLSIETAYQHHRPPSTKE